jgi:hypothetical protein
MKTLINSNLHFSNLFRELVAAYKKPPVTLKVVAEAFCGPENNSEFRKPPMICNLCGLFLHPVRVRHWRKSTNSRERRGNRI